MIISVSSLKGGSGKTTTALALATCAARNGYNVEVLDADTQGSACEWADIAADDGDPLPFEVLPVNTSRIERIKSDDIVHIIDTPPNGDICNAAAAAANFIVIPTRASGADMSKAWQTCITAVRMDKPHALLVTHGDNRTLTTRATLNEIEESGEPMFPEFIPRRTALESIFGRAFGEEMYGYDKAWDYIVEVLDNGD